MALLRPMYTQRLAQRLQSGAAIWIHAPAARGGQRLLADLKLLCQDEVQVYAIDAPPGQRDPAAMVVHLSHLIQQDPPLTTFGAWVESLRQRPGRHLLLLNHGDALLGPQAERAGFDAHFFQSFDQVSLHPQLAFLVVAEQALPAKGPASGCQIEPLTLPPLSLKRIREELTRRLGKDLPLQALATAIFAHPHPYPFLEFVAEQWSTQPELARLPDWKQAYDERHGLNRPAPAPDTPSIWQRVRDLFRA